ncbi:hypothetical protein NM208_g3263 [Fusarium decemcellulare]|nr:hypothetical protein NM208_g3263 [Fusarium decemcellulare]
MSVDIRGGAYGGGGKGETHGLNGKPGRDGSFNSSLLALRSIASSTELLIHPDQVSLTVAELENLYFVGTQDAIETVIQHVRPLKERLTFLDDLKPQDSLFKSYKEHEKDLMIIPSGTDIPTSISSLKNSLEHIRAIERKLYNGFDFYGHVASWVPSASFTFYKEQLQTVLDDFGVISQNYFNYQEIAQDQKRAKDRIECARKAVRLGIKSCQADIEVLHNQLEQSAHEIAVLQDGLPAKRKALVKKIQDSVEDIKHNFSISFEAFINAASTFVSSPGLLTGAIQAASLLHGGLETIRDDSDTVVKKEYVIDQITVMAAGLDGLKQAIEANKGGKLSVDDPGAAKLIAKEAEIQDLLTKYRKVLGSDKVKTIRDMFDDYVKVVIDRNNLIMHYNSCLVLWLTTKAKLVSYEQTAASLGRESVEKIQNEIPQLAAAVERNYIDTISTVMELLYRTAKALSYMTLSTEPTNFAKLRNQGFLQKGLAGALKQEKIDIIRAWANAIEHSSAMRQPFGGKNSCIIYRLTQEQLRSLLLEPDDKDKDHVVVLGIPAADKATSASESSFADYADIRLTRVRFYLEGAKTEDGELRIGLNHAGSEDMVTPNNTRIKVTHQPLSFKFHYCIETGKIFTDGKIRDKNDKEYALPGPFTSWRITVSRNYNKGLDLSNVSEAWFEFSGVSRTFQ